MFAYLFSPDTYLYVAVNNRKIKYKEYIILLMSVMISFMKISH